MRLWVEFEDTTNRHRRMRKKRSIRNSRLRTFWSSTAATGTFRNASRCTAINDAVQEGPHTAKMVHTVIDISELFQIRVIGATPLTVNITDDDLGDVMITPSGGSTELSEAGTTDTYEIALNMVPSGAVEITVQADAQTQVSVDGGTHLCRVTSVDLHRHDRRKRSRFERSMMRWSRARTSARSRTR